VQEISRRSDKLKLSLAANFDPEIVPELAKLSVDEIYGKPPDDGLGGGRPRYLGTPVSARELKAYVEELTRNGIAFNYLLNSACHGNREWTKSWQKKLMALLERLGGIGVQRLTVSTPYLLELVKRRFPSFRVRVGIYAQVDTPGRAKFWESLGADSITLESFSVNRDFKRLEEIRKAVSCELSLIANHLCLPNCPLQPYHQNGFAHASGADGDGALFIDYCALRCSRLRLEEPSLNIKSGWIRPEDLGLYRRLGYGSFKLLERGIPSSELLKRAKAYSEGRSPENLAELLLPFGFKEKRKAEPFNLIRSFFKPLQANPLKMLPLVKLAKSQGMLEPLEGRPPLRIESKELPEDFLDRIAEKGCGAGGCSSCGYCEEIAKKAVSLDPELREKALKGFAEAEEALKDGGLWGV